MLTATTRPGRVTVHLLCLLLLLLQHSRETCELEEEHSLLVVGIHCRGVREEREGGREGRREGGKEGGREEERGEGRKGRGERGREEGRDG